MESERVCGKADGHWDAQSFIVGFVVAAITSLLVVAVVFAPEPHRRSRVWRTDTGIVCKLDRYYPELDCKAVERAFGPRLSKLEVER